eukprot:840647-Rhodomonas_salina.2
MSGADRGQTQRLGHALCRTARLMGLTWAVAPPGVAVWSQHVLPLHAPLVRHCALDARDMRCPI